MERMGGRDQLLAQMYAAMATRRDDTVDLALRGYGAGSRPEAGLFAGPVLSRRMSQPRLPACCSAVAATWAWWAEVHMGARTNSSKHVQGGAAAVASTRAASVEAC